MLINKKFWFYQVFGVWYFVFGMKYTVQRQHVRKLNTKHKIQNTFFTELAFLTIYEVIEMIAV
jgi:hypothetical protein